MLWERIGELYLVYIGLVKAFDKVFFIYMVNYVSPKPTRPLRKGSGNNWGVGCS